MDQFFQPQDLGAIGPELELALFGMIVLVFDLLVQNKRVLGYISLAGLAWSGFFLFRLRNVVDAPAYGGVLALDPFAWFFKAIFLIAAALSIAISLKYLDIERENHGEYYALILFATMGMMFMVGAMDLVTLYIGLETMAIATYVLVGFLRSSQRSNEASLKYFLLGAFSSGILLYGFSLLYGMAGSTRFEAIRAVLEQRPLTDPLSMLALGTVAAGMFFKIAAVPFHQWTPDAYEGAPTSITAYMSVAVKAASFAMMVRLFMLALFPLRPALGRDHERRFRIDDDRRQYCGDHAIECETPAGILVDFARRIHPAWVDRRQRNRDGRDPDVSAGLHVHESGRLGHHRRSTAKRRDWRAYRRDERTVLQASCRGIADADFPACRLQEFLRPPDLSESTSCSRL